VSLVKISTLPLVRANLNYIYAQILKSHVTLTVVNSVRYVIGIHYLLSR